MVKTASGSRPLMDTAPAATDRILDVFGENYAAVPGQLLPGDIVAAQPCRVLFLDLSPSRFIFPSSADSALRSTPR